MGLIKLFFCPAGSYEDIPQRAKGDLGTIDEEEEEADEVTKGEREEFVTGREGEINWEEGGTEEFVTDRENKEEEIEQDENDLLDSGHGHIHGEKIG